MAEKNLIKSDMKANLTFLLLFLFFNGVTQTSGKITIEINKADFNYNDSVEIRVYNGSDDTIIGNLSSEILNDSDSYIYLADVKYRNSYSKAFWCSPDTLYPQSTRSYKNSR